MRSFCAFVLFIHSMLPTRHSSMFILSKNAAVLLFTPPALRQKCQKSAFFTALLLHKLVPFFQKYEQKGKAIIFICLYSETIVICQKTSYRLLV